MRHSNILIGEEAPYLYPLDNLIVDHETFTISIGSIENYQNSNFSKLLQAVSSIGSYCLSKRLGVKTKHFFLGETLRITRTAYYIEKGPLTIRAQSIIFTRRKGKSLIGIYDGNGNLAYRFEMDYTILADEAFRKLFRDLYSDYKPVYLSETMPATRNVEKNASSFSIIINPFSPENCLGHFNDYPMVPAVFMTNRLLAGIREWIEANTPVSAGPMQIECLEMFMKKAMPVNLSFKAEVSVLQLVGNALKFICSVHDGNGREYGLYCITIQS